MLPRSLTVLGDKIKIRQVSAKQMGEYESVGEDVLGLAHLVDDEIWIRNDIPEAHKKKVLAHEIFHIFCFKIGISQAIKLETEESLCQGFSQIYFQLKKQGM